ncbi:4-(cytidine 5'-diphospho)-2-C-methyl-D-erythritol kinase [Tumidithrix helvetica PCC 7403]|uniref:4-(cytidine 5'-diphospho)-2-C-methyl-D-erythritol kinase n=1 Tax=Tumidithrix helvetica TaxID=3457545 RepID=UPI003C8C0D51
MTSSISLKSAAKINLYLEITGNRPDGYHELVMVLQSIDLCDRLDLRTIGSDAIYISCDNEQVPTDETNLAFKAARLMQQNYPGLGGVEIAIAKQVPMGAGLAGGSGNAAAVLVGLDRLWDLGLTQSELCDLAAQLGSDIPFCVGGGTALAVGRGEVLSPLPDLQNLALVICKPRDLSISTVWAYQTFRSQGLLATSPVRDRHNSSQMLAAIAARDETTPTRVGRLLYNDLERVVLPAHPRIADLKASLQQQECLGVLMSGSGSTVFAIAQDLGQAERIAANLKADTNHSDLDIWVTTSAIGGILDV